MQSTHEALADLTAAFYSAFANGSGPAPVDTLYELCIPQAVIVNATGETPLIYDLREFVEPRRALLASGTVTNFSEYELSGQTEISGHIAQRLSRYEKTWEEGGVQKKGGGTKIFSFLRMPQRWKIASLLWYDHAL